MTLIILAQTLIIVVLVYLNLRKQAYFDEVVRIGRELARRNKELESRMKLILGGPNE